MCRHTGRVLSAAPEPSWSPPPPPARAPPATFLPVCVCQLALPRWPPFLLQLADEVYQLVIAAKAMLSRLPRAAAEAGVALVTTAALAVALWSSGALEMHVEGSTMGGER